ncbi:MAG TPA: YdjY domain-containing protein [Planctomycetota bacterium]
MNFLLLPVLLVSIRCEPDELRQVELPAPAVAEAPEAMEAMEPAQAQDPGDAVAKARGILVDELARQGVYLDFDAGIIRMQARVTQVYEPLEYLVVIAARGKTHESLFGVEELDAVALNTAFKLLGASEGVNGTMSPRDPPPTPEEYAAGVAGYTVTPAHGDGFYLYAYWQEPGADGEPEEHFHRAEDLVLNVRADRTYQRGRFIYLGSRFVKPHKDALEMYAAQAEGNLVSLVYFTPANHMLTGADPEADDQNVWYPNVFLLPSQNHAVTLLFCRERLDPVPPAAPRDVDGDR